MISVLGCEYIMDDVSEKEIVYEFDMCNPESSYMKRLYGRVSRKYITLRRVVLALIIAEVIALAFLDRSSTKNVWIIFLAFAFGFCVCDFFILPRKRKKIYEKLHAAKEDLFSYTFYKDSVRMKNQSVELTLKYDTAEFFAEDDERLMIIFPFNRTISIDKKQCDEERLAFFRSIVPEESQKKVEKKTSRRLFIESVCFILYALLIAVVIVLEVRINAHSYYPEYPNTTYVSFEACLNGGTIKDVVIINEKYVEYTFTGRGEDERYYTVYTGEIDELTEKLDDADVDWRSE